MVSCGVGCRHSLDLTLLWLWRRPVATAPIQALAWELLYAIGAALKRPKKKKIISESENNSANNLYLYLTKLDNYLKSSLIFGMKNKVNVD